MLSQQNKIPYILFFPKLVNFQLSAERIIIIIIIQFLLVIKHIYINRYKLKSIFNGNLYFIHFNLFLLSSNSQRK